MNTPGVESVAAIDMMPMGGSGGTTSFVVEGKPAPPKGQYPEANSRTASPGYFKTMRIPVLEGREFDEHDTPALEEVLSRANILRDPLVPHVVDGQGRRFLCDADPLGELAGRDIEASAFRARLLRLSAEEHVVLVNMHHIVSDGWSLGVLVEEMGQIYEAELEGKRAALAPLAPVSTADASNSSCNDNCSTSVSRRSVSSNLKLPLCTG